MSSSSPCLGSVEELRTYWQVPSIAHFIYLFKDGLKLAKSDYHDLEISFLTPFPESDGSSDDDQSNDDHILLRLIVELLKGYFNEYRINASNWENYLKKLCRLLWVDREGNPSPFHVYTYDQRGNKYEQEIGFADLTLDQKVEVVYHLCEYRLYAEDSSDLVSHLVDDELRVIEPLGKDSRGNNYWYFFGTRLYRENPDAVKNVDHIRESIARYRARKSLEESQNLVKQQQQQQQLESPETKTASIRKKFKADHIPGERSSSRISKPVDRLNGHTLTSSSKKTSDSKSRNSNSTKSPNHQSQSGSSKKQPLPEVAPDPATSCGIPLSDLKSAWDCVCDHESEWESLTESFSKAKVPCEVELYQILSKNFLPLIREVAEKERKEKEKQQKAKILELLPRRTSSRIEIKKIQQEEEEKKMEQEKEDRKRRSAQAEERRKREEERIRQEEVKRQREERARQRLAIIEDRAARANLRKHRLNINNNNVLNHEDDDSYCADSNGLSDDDVIDLADPDVTMILSNGWPPSEHSYSSPKGFLVSKKCF